MPTLTRRARESRQSRRSRPVPWYANSRWQGKVKRKDLGSEWKPLLSLIERMERQGVGRIRAVFTQDENGNVFWKLPD